MKVISTAQAGTGGGPKASALMACRWTSKMGSSLPCGLRGRATEFPALRADTLVLDTTECPSAKWKISSLGFSLHNEFVIMNS